MSRPIKFRAWDKNQGMIYGDLQTTWANTDLETIMQYTGLTDKNGIEIYEGDILAYWDKKQSTHTVEVKWSDEMSAWDLSNKYGDAQPYTQSSYEVIGNVWENKELLK